MCEANKDIIVIIISQSIYKKKKEDCAQMDTRGIGSLGFYMNCSRTLGRS